MRYTQTMFWADELAKKIIDERGKKQTVATGITPSGFIHVGNLRETTVGDVAQKALKHAGADVRFIWIADDFDRLRKVYPFLPASYDQHVGKALSKIPDPFGNCHQSYSDHFMADFIATLPKVGIKPEILSATKLYQDGVYAEKITIALQKKELIQKILQEVSGRELPPDWSPYVPYCEKCGKDNTKILSEDLPQQRVKYSCECGYQGWSNYAKGEGKLVWRVDWAARWSIFGVTAEPLGKEHATTGGSYDTGKKIAKQVFDFVAPEKIFYEFLYLKGSKGKMSSSLGNVVAASEMVAFVPSAVLRYLLIKNKDRHIELDPGAGLLQLVNDYTALEKKTHDGTANKDEQALYYYSQIGSGKARAHIPFSHLVNVFQAANGKTEEVLRLLKQTQHIEDKKLIVDDLDRVKIWLERYAPEEVKFTLQKTLFKVELSEAQKKLLAGIADSLEKTNNPDELHQTIYNNGKKLGLSPKETFEPLYRVLLNKPSGPKAGWFLMQLDKKFVIKRLYEASGR